MESYMWWNILAFIACYAVYSATGKVEYSIGTLLFVIVLGMSLA